MVTLITGGKRGGQSTLMLRLPEENWEDIFFLIFEDTRLARFETDDFSQPDSVIELSHARIFFFREIQMLNNRELYARQKLDEGFKVASPGGPPPRRLSIKS